MITTHRSFPSRALALALILALVAPFAPVRAATYTWDPSGNRSDAAGSGSWNTTAGNAVWDNGTADVVWPNTNSLSDNAIFSGADGNYPVVVADGISAPTTFFNAGGYILVGASAASPGTLTFSMIASQVSIAPGKTLTIGANLTANATSYFNTLVANPGTGSVVNGGALAFSGTVTIAGGFNVGTGGAIESNLTTMSMSGGTISINGAGATFAARGIGMT